MPEKKELMVYAGSYNSLEDALSDLKAVENLEKVGHFDAAVIDKDKGKPHIARRVDRPRIRMIPGHFGPGSLPRQELKDAATSLTSTDAGLIVVGEPSMEKEVTSAMSKCKKVVTQTLKASEDEVVSELQQALSGTSES